MTSHIKQLIPVSLLNISVVGLKVSSSLKTTIHEVFTFWYHINKIHTQINQLAVTDKILSQPGIQLCVASVAVQSWQTDFHGLHGDFPGLFNIHVSSEQRSYLWFTRDLKNIPVTLWYSEQVNQPVFSNSRHCALSACSPTVWLLRLYTGNESNVCDNCAVLADKNCNWQQWCFAILDIRGWYCTGL